MTRQEAQNSLLRWIDEEIAKCGENENFMASPKIGKNSWSLKEARESVINDVELEDSGTNLIDDLLNLEKWHNERNIPFKINA